MITPHFRTIPTSISGSTQVFEAVPPKGNGVREWTFLPPIIAMWCRADGMPAVQVRDNTQVVAKEISLYTLCDQYDSGTDNRYAATIIEADPGEYTPNDPVEDVYNYVAQVPACPGSGNYMFGPSRWATAVTIVAYGGNNDGNVCGTLALRRLTATDDDIYFITSPGVLRVDRYFYYLTYTRMDWTGGANWATVDIWVAERYRNTELA